MTSYYCTDTLTSKEDLDKIYFMDSQKNRYYFIAVIGRYNIPETLISCTNGESGQLSNMTSVSIPANGYAYFYQNSESSSPNMRLSGDYYTVNLDLTSNSTGKYSGQQIIDYNYQPNFAIDCNCSVGGTNANMCGSLYGTKTIGCAPYSNDKPPNHVPIPRKFTPNIERSYSTSFWWLIWLTLGIIVIILLVMVLLIFGVFNTTPKTMPPKIENQTPSQSSQVRSEFLPGF